MPKLITAVIVLMATSTTVFAQGAVGGAPPVTGGVTAADSVRQMEMLPARVVADAARVFNASGTLRLRADTRIPADSTVSGDIAILGGGQLTIAGHVRGRVIAINSDVILAPSAQLDKDILVIGGTVGSRENGRVRGDIRIYRPRMVIAEQGETIVPDPRYTDEGKWWSGLQLDAPHDRSRITVRGATYNRVEGLPILIGPAFRHTGPHFRTSVEALGIIRSAARFRWDSENLGHQVDVSTRLNRERGFGLGVSLYDVVSPVEDWQFTEHEAGLSTFLLHRDFRDYYGRHGGSATLTLYRDYQRELRLSYGNERWMSREVRDTWTIFRDAQPWRANPEVHEGKMHLATARLLVDTRNSETNPWTGWLVDASVEHGSGELAGPGNPAAFVPTEYSRAMMDLRRYNRISPRGQLNVRIVYGARLGDDELPLQKRFSLGGPGSLPGFDFRRTHGGTDVGMCSSGSAIPAPGAPALCERMALIQLEYRGDIHLDIFGSADRNESHWRDVGHHPGSQWVIFADAGRGWLLGEAGGNDGLTYHSRTVLPRFGSFRTDVGVGLSLGAVGVFAAKAVSQKGIPTNFFVRLRHRF